MKTTSRAAPATPTASPIVISRKNSRTTDHPEAPSVVANSTIPIRSAIPTGSFTPASPSRIVPVLPWISLSPRIENMTAGSVGASAAPSTPDSVQLRSSRKWAQTAVRTAVVSVPTMPSVAIGTTARRNRRQPMFMPPSKRIRTTATTPIRSTVLMCGRATGSASAASRKSAGAGTG